MIMLLHHQSSDRKSIMHSTTLTDPIRQHYVERAFASSTVIMHPDRAAELAMRTMIPRLRKRETLCPQCHTVIRARAAAVCDYC